MASVPSRNQFLIIAVKTHAKADNQSLENQPGLNLLDFVFLPDILSRIAISVLIKKAYEGKSRDMFYFSFWVTGTVNTISVNHFQPKLVSEM